MAGQHRHYHGLCGWFTRKMTKTVGFFKERPAQREHGCPVPMRAAPSAGPRGARADKLYSHSSSCGLPQRPSGATGKGPIRTRRRGAGLGRNGPGRGRSRPGVAAALRLARHGLRPGLSLHQLAHQPLVDRGFPQGCENGLGSRKAPVANGRPTFAVIALLRVVALALVDLREKSWFNPGLPAEAAGLTTTALQLLRHQRRRPLATV